MIKYLLPLLLIPFMAFATIKVALIGDSITNGYGVKKEESFAYLLQEMFNKEGKDVQVCNRSFNGAQTNTGEMIVVDLLTSDKPKIAVINLGVNDAGFGVSQAELLKNFDKMVWKLFVNDVIVIIGGIDGSATMPGYMPTLWAVYNQMIANYHIIPFAFLTPDILLNKSIGDHLHPNAEGHKVIAEELFKVIKTLGI